MSVIQRESVEKIRRKPAPNGDACVEFKARTFRLKSYLRESFFKPLVIVRAVLVYQQSPFRPAILQNRLD